MCAFCLASLDTGCVSTKTDSWSFAVTTINVMRLKSDTCPENSRAEARAAALEIADRLEPEAAEVLQALMKQSASRLDIRALMERTEVAAVSRFDLPRAIFAAWNGAIGVPSGDESTTIISATIFTHSSSLQKRLMAHSPKSPPAESPTSSEVPTSAIDASPKMPASFEPHTGLNKDEKVVKGEGLKAEVVVSSLSPARENPMAAASGDNSAQKQLASSRPDDKDELDHVSLELAALKLSEKQHAPMPVAALPPQAPLKQPADTKAAKRRALQEKGKEKDEGSDDEDKNEEEQQRKDHTVAEIALNETMALYNAVVNHNHAKIKDLVSEDVATAWKTVRLVSAFSSR